MDQEESLRILTQRLEELLNRQVGFYKEITQLRTEIEQLKNAKPITNAPAPVQMEAVQEEKIVQAALIISSDAAEKIQEQIAPIVAKEVKGTLESKPNSVFQAPKIKSNIEKFIGENLINKIGILFVVIGVSFGAQYAISHSLISELTRIILGYLAGVALLGTAIWLKPKYETFSAVLLSGSLAILYFISFLGYSLYHLFPQSIAFGLMVLFTIFSVIAALNYNKQVIAIIGLVGAYAVPFLLSDGSGKVLILFTYMVIINIGILFISFKKSWKPLHYAAFFMTWLIYIAWFSTAYKMNQHFKLACIYSACFFIIFYLMFVCIKLIRKEALNVWDVILLLLNSFIFFVLGYLTLDEHSVLKDFLGLFTLLNALIHFIIGMIIYRQKLASKDLFYLIIALVFVFITISIPVQLDGNWVTILWAVEAALLFIFGRRYQIAIYEKISFCLMALAFGSQFQDWMTNPISDAYQVSKEKFLPVFNVGFLSSVMVVASFVFINFFHFKKQYVSTLKDEKNKIFLNYLLPAAMLCLVYFVFRMQISFYWDHLYAQSFIEYTKPGDDFAQSIWNEDLKWKGELWVLNYSLIFLAILSFINIKILKQEKLGIVNLVLNTLALFYFCGQGLYMISELRESFLTHRLVQYYQHGMMNIIIRYLSILSFAVLLFVNYVYVKQEFIRLKLKIYFELTFYTLLLWIFSSEVIHWMDMAYSTQSYKLGLSILWGSYSLGLIIIGIWKNRKYLRIGAIALFGITLLKLFFYDLNDLDSMAKTIVFVLLGVLLLIISFLYNKYKHLIIEVNDN